MKEKALIKRLEIIERVHAERLRQDDKWGFPQKNSLPEWGVILAEEVGEVMTEINESHFRQRPHHDLITELIQVAAVAISIVEHLEHEKGEHGYSEH